MESEYPGALRLDYRSAICMHRVSQPYQRISLTMQIDHMVGLLAEALFFLHRSMVPIQMHLVNSVVAKRADRTPMDLCQRLDRRQILQRALPHKLESTLTVMLSRMPTSTILASGLLNRME